MQLTASSSELRISGCSQQSRVCCGRKRSDVPLISLSSFHYDGADTGNGSRPSTASMLSLKLVVEFTLAVCLVILFSTAVCPLPSSPPNKRIFKATYFVSSTGSDLNSGDQTKPWATIQHAADAARPGTTVEVAPGMYVENELALRNSGTAVSRIRFISGQKWAAKIRSSS